MINIYVKSKPCTGQTKQMQKDFSFFLQVANYCPHMKPLLKIISVSVLKSHSTPPFVKSVQTPFPPGDTISGPTLLCSRITHFHSHGSSLSLLSNQVDLFILIFHVFLCYVIYPSRTSCRKQQRLGVVLRTWKERPLISVIATDSET